MNTMLFPEDVINVIQSFYLTRKNDTEELDLILCIGAELLDVSVDTMLEMLNLNEKGE